MFYFLGYSWLLVTLSMIGKYLDTIVFMVIYTYTIEIYSTTIRGLGLSICSSSARLGATVGAYTGLLVSTGC